MAINQKDEDIFNLIVESYKRERQLNLASLGIPDNGYFYHIINNGQERYTEFEKTEKFLKWLIEKNPEEFDENTAIKFINYGDTELVYVVDESGYQRTLLVGQPNTKFGTVKIEYDNLIKLYQLNPTLIVCPTKYFSNKGREAYITPYFHQARCIATSDIGWGAYVPEPCYSFIQYNEDDAYIVCTTIIANLVTLYNEYEKLGLASCKIGGGDFILEKEWDNEKHTIENTLKRMHLIAARDLISIDFTTYINLLKSEFSRKTYYKKIEEKDSTILVNCKNREPMIKEAIEDGIALGLKLRKNSRNDKLI